MPASPSKELEVRFSRRAPDWLGWQFFIGRDRLSIFTEALQIRADRVNGHSPGFFERVTRQCRTRNHVPSFFGGFKQHRVVV